MRNSKVIYIPEFDCFGKEYEITYTPENMEVFLKVWGVETLNRLMDSAIEHENYEVANIIKEVIDNQ